MKFVEIYRPSTPRRHLKIAGHQQPVCGTRRGTSAFHVRPRGNPLIGSRRPLRTFDEVYPQCVGCLHWLEEAGLEWPARDFEAVDREEQR